MTDPNIPPPERVVHQARNHARSVAPGSKRKGGGLLALMAGGLVVAALALAWFLYAGGRSAAPERTEINLDINVPTPRLPETPHLPERPVLPDVPRPAEPPTVAAPSVEPQA